jgi:uncharacterized protein YndB with AHSA1/START domain
MSERSTVHATIEVERRLKAPPARVFAAWSDAEARKRWDTPGQGTEVLSHEQDFRVGGREASRFRSSTGKVFESAGEYLEIVPDARIVSAGTMRAGELRSSATLCTIEIIADGNGTHLMLTDQSVYFDGHESPADRKSGWGGLMDKLETFLTDLKPE